MREIKFRGYNDYDKKWIYGNLIRDENGGYVIGRYYQDLIDDVDISLIASVDMDSISQFTGCKDIKGNDIYEGDILKFDENLIGVVQFKYGTFRIYLHSISKDAFYYKKEKKCYGFINKSIGKIIGKITQFKYGVSKTHLTYDIKYIFYDKEEKKCYLFINEAVGEVIGNIYENKDLICEKMNIK